MLDWPACSDWGCFLAWETAQLVRPRLAAWCKRHVTRSSCSMLCFSMHPTFRCLRSWFDIRPTNPLHNTLLSLMEKRIDLAASKGTYIHGDALY